MAIIYITEGQANAIKNTPQWQVGNKVNSGLMDGIVGEGAEPESDNYSIGFEGDSNNEYGHVIQESDEMSDVPDKCHKCGGNIVIKIMGEPIYVCDKCGKYYGTVPFKSCLKEENEKFFTEEFFKGEFYKEKFRELANFMKEEGVNVYPFPELKLNWEKQDGLFIKTGYYEPQTKTIHVFCDSRHPKDIMRTFAHEMIHHSQNLSGMNLQFTSSDNVKDSSDLEKIEADAYLRGNIYFRKWTEYEQQNNGVINESKAINEYADISDIFIYPCKNYYNDNGARELCHKFKEGDEDAIDIMAYEMSKNVSPKNILVPVPSRNGHSTQTLMLANKIAEITGASVKDIISGKSRESLYNLKLGGFEADNDFFGYSSSESPDKNMILVDNVLDTGSTAKAASDATGIKKVLVYAKTELNPLEEQVSYNDVSLKSFKVKEHLNPKFWKNEKLDSRVRSKLLDIAYDFIDFLNIGWVSPEDIIMTGSLANYNWDKKYSDIDLHILVDYSKVDKRTDFVRNYFQAQKNIWNEKHEGIRILGFPVEVYVQDVKEKHTSSGVYSIENNKWIDEPDRDNMDDSDLNHDKIKKTVAKYMNKIDSLNDEYKSNDLSEKKLKSLLSKTENLFDEIKSKRAESLNKSNKEMCDGNIIFKCLRRLNYIEKIVDLKAKIYDKIQSM